MSTTRYNSQVQRAVCRLVYCKWCTVSHSPILRNLLIKGVTEAIWFYVWVNPMQWTTEGTHSFDGSRWTRLLYITCYKVYIQTVKRKGWLSNVKDIKTSCICNPADPHMQVCKQFFLAVLDITSLTASYLLIVLTYFLTVGNSKLPFPSVFPSSHHLTIYMLWQGRQHNKARNKQRIWSSLWPIC